MGLWYIAKYKSNYSSLKSGVVVQACIPKQLGVGVEASLGYKTMPQKTKANTKQKQNQTKPKKSQNETLYCALTMKANLCTDAQMCGCLFLLEKLNVSRMLTTTRHGASSPFFRVDGISVLRLSNPRMLLHRNT